MPENVGRDEVQRLVRGGAQLLEVLGSREYEEAHLPGAMNIPLSKLARETAAVLDDQRPVIVYCNDMQ